MMISKGLAFGAMGALAGSLVFAHGAQAESVKDFFSGKRVSMYISSGAGGTNDTYARLVARHLGAHLPGSPRILPRNMPGAGGLRAAKFLYTAAPKDGSVMGVVQRSVAVQPILGVKAANYDPLRFNWVGSTNSEVSTGVIWNTSPLKTLKDTMKQPLVVGSSGIGTDTGAFPRVLNFFLGTKFDIVHGYKSGTDILLALERGEVRGRIGWSWSSVKSREPKKLKDGTFRIIVQMGLKKAKDLDAPLALDYARTPADRRAMEVIFAATTIGWPSLLPPDVPTDRVKAYRAAYKATMVDPKFVTAAKRRRLSIDPVTGEEIQDIIRKISSYPKEDIALARRAYTSGMERAQKVKLMTVAGAISKINKKGSKLTLSGGGKKVKARVSRRSKITIAGKKAKRKALKKGMDCSMKLAGIGGVIHTIACK